MIYFVFVQDELALTTLDDLEARLYAARQDGGGKVVPVKTEEVQVIEQEYYYR